VSDLFFIEMAAHGLISKEKREEYKQRSWELVVDHHNKNYSPYKGTFEQVFELVVGLTKTANSSCKSIF
jgi:hypothetical protein